MLSLYSLHRKQNFLVTSWKVGPDSSVGITTRYRLSGPGIESADPSGRAV